MGLKKVAFGLLCKGIIGQVFNSISFKKYMRYTLWYYKKMGVNINPPITYIHPSVYIDSHNFSLITIGKNVTISRNVTLLVHDYSIATALSYSGYLFDEGIPHFEKKIVIGNDSFIGANAILLPGTIVGCNSIVGAGSVLKGEYPDNCIIVGNPAKVIKNTKEWVDRKIESKDWSIN